MSTYNSHNSYSYSEVKRKACLKAKLTKIRMTEWEKNVLLTRFLVSSNINQ